MTTLGDVMTPNPKTIGQEQTLLKAMAVMRELGVRHLPVLHGGQIVGIVSSRDVEIVQRLEGVDAEHVTVEEAMSTEPYVAQASDGLDEVARQMAEHKYGAVVVMDGKSVVGIFTTVDALRELADREQ